MSDNADDALVGWGEAHQVGEMIVNMCDRVKKMHSIAPGTEAKWVLGVEDTDFEIIVRVKKEK